MNTRFTVLACALALAGCERDTTDLNVPQPATGRGGGPAMTDHPAGADQAASADDSKLNKRDRDDTVTPTDQGGSEAERNVTAAIRKSVVGDDRLSMDAKNVKIVTVGSKVTLRGPVQTARERDVIKDIATRTAGVTEVDDQLEVKK